MKNLKKLGMVDVYVKQCRSVLELAVPAWSPGLKVSDSNQIERVQKSALAIILGDEYTKYSNALRILKLDTLVDRRDALCLKFAKKFFLSEKFSQLFCESDTGMKLAEVKTRTSRYWKSPLPYLTDLLNDELSK